MRQVLDTTPAERPPQSTSPELEDMPAAAVGADEGGGVGEEGAPDELLCPVSQMLLTDPVVAADGITYQREALQQCIDFARQRECISHAWMPRCLVHQVSC